MTTPEPRLSDRRSREPKPWSSPKKYRKNGSLPNGEFVVRTTCSDEILATPRTACAATFEKSGKPPVTATGGTVAGTGAAVCALAEGASTAAVSPGAAGVTPVTPVIGVTVVRARVVSASPAANPARTNTS